MGCALAQDPPVSCNSTCAYPDAWKNIVTCGTVVSEHPVNGPKCAYLTKVRDRYPVVKSLCENLELEDPNQPGQMIKTGSLITMNTMVENNRTRDHINNLNTAGTSIYYPYAFIGLRKTCRECSFYWEDLEPVTFSNWYGSEPNTYYYDCTHIRTTSPYFGQWIDMSCSSFYHGVCQFFKDGEPKYEDVTLPARGGCKAGWWKFGGYCYLDFGYKVNPGDSSLNTDNFDTYLNANRSCNDAWMGARMAMMPTREHNAMLASLMGPFYFGSDAWVGIYNWAYYDYYFSLDNKDKLTYANWMYGKPNHIQSNVDKCTIMKWRTDTTYHGGYSVGQWENTHCTSKQYPWICSHEQSSEFPATSYQYPRKFILPDVNCPNDWMPYHSACYKLFTDKKNFDDANQFCKDNGPGGEQLSYLLTLWDEYELEFGRVFLRDDQLPNRRPDDIPEGYWMGLHYGSERGEDYERWKWVDGFPVTRSNWAPAHPDSPQNKCAFMNTDGQFESAQCSTPRGFVCKAEFYEAYPPTDNDIDAALGLPLPCDDGWNLTGHRCNKIFPTALPYDQAQQDCVRQGGNLGSIHSNRHNRYIKDMFSQLALEARGMWIGLMWKGPSKGWQWEDRSSVSFTHWDQGEPNNWNEQVEDCTEFLKSGQWNDDPCNATYPYYCKKIAETEYCAAARTSGLKPCGFVGITEEECQKEWLCCYDPLEEVAPGQNCFKPKQPIDVGMAAGTAVGITIGVLLIAGGAFFAVQKWGNPFSSVGGGISNPVA